MTIAQKPNPPLIIALIGFVLSKFTHGVVHQIGSALFTVSIIIWAYQEITTGVNWFRKTLGWLILLAVSLSLILQMK